MPELDWVECPRCTKTVFLASGVLGEHIAPREARKWPKLSEVCPRSGTRLEREPILEM